MEGTIMNYTTDVSVGLSGYYKLEIVSVDQSR